MKSVPRATYTLVFDGGSRGNPGLMYGSFRVQWAGGPGVLHSRLAFGRGTGNEAEYRTLIAGLESLLAELERRSLDPADVELEVLGDSLLVLRQLTGEWRAREPRMALLRDQAQGLLRRFGHVRLRHRGRAHSVALLGH